VYQIGKVMLDTETSIQINVRQSLIQEIEQTSDYLLSEVLDFLLFVKDKHSPLETKTDNFESVRVYESSQQAQILLRQAQEQLQLSQLVIQRQENLAQTLQSRIDKLERELQDVHINYDDDPKEKILEDLRQSFQDVQAGRVHDISQLWDGIDV
jgi:hypothetical protein